MAIGLVDVAALGHASVTELGGASIGRALSFAASSLGIGIAAALDPLAAQAVGAREDEEAWLAFRAAVAACVIVFVPTAALAVASTWLLVPLGIEPALVAPARAFLVAQLPGQLAFSVFLAAKSFLQAHDRTAETLGSAVVANVVNLGLCNVLVRGDDALAAVGLPRVGAPALGACGAGLASSLATMLLAGSMLVAARRVRGAAHGGAAVPTLKVLRLGLPLGAQVLAETGAFSLAALLSARLGSAAASAHQVAVGLASFTFMGALGVSAATAVRVGHAIGERRSPRRAGLVGIALGAVYMSPTAVLFLALRRPLAAVFSDDVAVIDLGAKLLVVAGAFQLFDGVQAVAAGALRGAADVRFPFLANVGAHWLVGLPLALWLGFGVGLGAQGIWLGLLVGLAIVALLLSWRFVTIARGPIARA
jgi:MATE family multidrug resistance protein